MNTTIQQQAAVERMFHGGSRNEEGVTSADSDVIDAGRCLEEAARQTREIGGSVVRAIEFIEKAKKLFARAIANGYREE